jgi:hypothetical protein
MGGVSSVGEVETVLSASRKPPSRTVSSFSADITHILTRWRMSFLCSQTLSHRITSPTAPTQLSHNTTTQTRTSHTLACHRIVPSVPIPATHTTRYHTAPYDTIRTLGSAPLPCQHSTAEVSPSRGGPPQRRGGHPLSTPLRERVAPVPRARHRPRTRNCHRVALRGLRHHLRAHREGAPK